jgi:CheY-like chemotaxis protein
MPGMEQWTALLGVVAWPLVVVFCVFLFREVLRDVLSRDDLSLSAPAGITFSAKRAAGALMDASEAKRRASGNESSAPGHLSEADAEDQVQEVAGFVGRLRRSPHLLWVDDMPSNNRYERSAIESMGMIVDLSTSTNDAQRKLRRRGEYDVIISDMARPEGSQAGYELLRWMRERGDKTPFVIYSSSNSPAHFDEAVRRGAVGSSASPGELIDMILRSLRDARPRSRWWSRRSG